MIDLLQLTMVLLAGLLLVVTLAINNGFNFVKKCLVGLLNALVAVFFQLLGFAVGNHSQVGYTQRIHHSTIILLNTPQP